MKQNFSGKMKAFNLGGRAGSCIEIDGEIRYSFAMTVKDSSSECPVCGATTTLLKGTESFVCTFCGSSEQGHIKCPEGHFICEACRGKTVLQVIEDISLTTMSQDPLATAELMMAHPGLPMLGCEHASIVAGAFMAALKNSPYGSGKITNDDIHEAFKRTAKQAVSGHCGLTGVCGIAPAVGACFSIFLGARCGSDSEQKITMEAVIRVSKAIADLTGPSCCKAYARAAITEASTMFGERFGIILPVRSGAAALCSHSGKHPHGCREEKCPYYQKPSRDIFAEAKFVPGMVCTS